MFRITNKLSRKLAFSIILLATPIFLLSLGILFYMSQHLIRKEAIERTNNILNTSMLRIKNYMSTIETSVNTNAWLIEEHLTPATMFNVSRQILRVNPNILSCSISTEPDILPQYGEHFSVYATRQGDSIFSVQETNYDYFDKLWYKAPLQQAKACWVDPFSEHTEGTINHNEAVASYCRPLRLEGGKNAGVLVADFSFRQLADVLNATELPYDNTYFVLIGKDGRFFIHPDSTRLFRKTIYTDIDADKDADIIALGYEMTNGKRGHMHIHLNGQLQHVCYQPVPGTGWSLALVSPDSEILAVYHRQAYIIGIIIILGLLGILLLSRHVVTRTVNSINRLLNMTTKIAEGNYDEQIPHSKRQDYLGLLQNSFATMQQSLRENMGKIHSATEELKKRNINSEDEIEQAELASKRKETFIRSVTHQIRTPLNIITGFADVLGDSVKAQHANGEDNRQLNDDSMTQITNTMMYNAILLKRMVLMLYDSSDIGSIEEKNSCKREEELSCNELARDAISYTESHFPGLKIQFETEVSDDVYILTNYIYLIRTLRELLHNAAKFSDKRHIVMRVEMTDTNVRFIVQDVGPGLPEDSKELFEQPFVKPDETSEGLGLGLPLSKRHAVNLGGELIHDTTYRKGCRIIMVLPR